MAAVTASSLMQDHLAAAAAGLAASCSVWSLVQAYCGDDDFFLFNVLITSHIVNNIHHIISTGFQSLISLANLSDKRRFRVRKKGENIDQCSIQF